MIFRKRTQNGFTLAELLIVVALLAILMTAAGTNWFTQIKKSSDMRKKGDIFRLKGVLENYINDHGCYPTEAQMHTCGAANQLFVPYNMPVVPCELLKSQTPYLYQLIDSSNACKGYRIYAVLDFKQDLDIVRVGCDTPGYGCNVPLHPEYNYGVAVGGPVAQ
jgi:prepilin-type N-terminal cleavage/methylation domain-containing protein